MQLQINGCVNLHKDILYEWNLSKGWGETFVGMYSDERIDVESKGVVFLLVIGCRGNRFVQGLHLSSFSRKFLFMTVAEVWECLLSRQAWSCTWWLVYPKHQDFTEDQMKNGLPADDLAVVNLYG